MCLLTGFVCACVSVCWNWLPWQFLFSSLNHSGFWIILNPSSKNRAMISPLYIDPGRHPAARQHHILYQLHGGPCGLPCDTKHVFALFLDWYRRIYSWAWCSSGRFKGVWKCCDGHRVCVVKVKVGSCVGLSEPSGLACWTAIGTTGYKREKVQWFNFPRSIVSISNMMIIILCIHEGLKRENQKLAKALKWSQLCQWDHFHIFIVPREYCK